MGVLVIGLFFILFRTTVGPRNATNDYFAAIIAQDWSAAQATVSTGQRNANTPASLEATWAARTRTHGPAASFRSTSFRVRTSTARVSDTLRYGDGTTEGRTVQLVKEGDAWKIASDP